MRKAFALAFLLVLAAACGKPFGGPPLTSADYKLYEAATTPTTENVAVIDSQTHAVQRKLPLGAVNQAWTHIYSIGSRQLVDTDPLSGATLRTLQLPIDYQLPPATMSGLPGGLSPDGRFLALEAWDRSSTTPSATHLLIVDTSFASAPVRVELKGWFEFDAISDDGQRLYLIEYLTPGEYRVRLYLVSGQTLSETVIKDKSDPKDSMTGLRLSGTPSSDGQFLYSVYARQNDGAFIHALPLNGMPVAFCVDLPSPGYQSDLDATRWALAMAPDGTALYAVNAALGLIDVIGVGPQTLPSLSRSAHFTANGSSATSLVTNAQAKEFGSTAVISPDGTTIVTAGASGIVWVDTASLHVKWTALNDWRVMGLATGPDGKLIYAVSDSGMMAELTFASAKIGTVFDAGASGYPITLMRVAAA